MDYVLNIIPQMMDGCLVSFQVFIITIVLSIPLGILLSLGRVSGIKPLQALIGGYVWILRGSPLMLQIFFVYFVLPSVGIRLPDFESAIVAFVLNYAAYFCEIFRAGIQAIPAGQYEAAHTLGMNYVQTMRRIILPQVIRIILPPISNETITLVKDTSLVYVLAMNDLMRTARNLVQRDFSITPFIVAAVFYLLATLILTIVFERLEMRAKLLPLSALGVVARAPCCAASTSWKRLIRAALLSTVKSCAVKPPVARNMSRTMMSAASPAKWAWYSSSSTFFRI